MDDLESKMKEKLLEGLIDHMQGKMGDSLESKFPKKHMEVTVAAPDKEHLQKGLEKAQELTDQPESSDEGSDEDRLMDLLGHDDDEDDKKGMM